MASPRNRITGEGATKVLVTRLIWFGLGLSSAIFYNQLMWQQQRPLLGSNNIQTAAVIQADQAMNEREEEELARILEEIQAVRRDYQRMKVSRDLAKERMEECQAKCPESKE